MYVNLFCSIYSNSLGCDLLESITGIAAARIAVAFGRLE
jgi:hypothetical protein